MFQFGFFSAKETVNYYKEKADFIEEQCYSQYTPKPNWKPIENSTTVQIDQAIMN